MRRHTQFLLCACVLALVAGLPVPSTRAAASTCDPTGTVPDYRGRVPTPREVLGFDLGEREVTTAESDRYLEAVARSSNRVVPGTLATSWQGRPLRYAIVGHPDRVNRAGLADVRRRAALLRNPQTPDALARLVARHSPLILWVTANVHGNEESGTDAALRTLRDLADREDCAARRILDNAVVVIVPVQNPDGREADTRRNVYGFDMNRDWFARTQPETDGKLALLQDYPPVLFIDAHEMGGTGYFFPPNADPFHHEIAEPTVDWINNVYGAAMAAEFTRRGIDFFNRDVYDMFYMGYGDTVPTTGFLSAGMTFEKGGESPIAERTEEQYLTQWVSLSAAAARRTAMLEQWHAMHVEAFRQGSEGRLEPNQVYNPGNEVITRVPDRQVRHYFLTAGQRDVGTVVRRLQRMGVAVRRLVLPLTVPDYRAYGRAPARVTLPAGTYWVPMAQAQKHWIQAILGEDSYTPFPYFYDVTGWSMPLLANISGGSSGALLRPIAVPALPVPAPGPPERPAKLGQVGVLQLSATSTAAIESTGWLRYLLDRVWRVPYRLLTPADVAAGGLTGLSVLLVPNGPAAAAQDALGAAGAAALRTWVDSGGRYVGWRGGTALAARLGVTTAMLTPSTSAVPGTLFRVRVAPGSPLGSGVGGTAWQFYQSGTDAVMRASDPAHVAVSYPATGSPDWFVSGFALGAEELASTAAVVDEPIGRGRAVLFGGEPNFRAFTDGTAKILWNAIAGPPSSLSPEAASTAERSAARRAAQALPSVESPISIHVRAPDAARAAEVLDRFGARWTEQRSAGRVTFVVDNPDGLSADEHPWAAQLPSALRHTAVVPLAVILP